MNTPQEGGGSTPGARERLINLLANYKVGVPGNASDLIDELEALIDTTVQERLLALPSMKKEIYEEIPYPRTDDEGEPLWSKNAIRESRKQRMQRVVNRNELRATLRAEIKGEK